jgi:mannose/fructose/N-acetylgalactosamine-specific phosphotransferase system component IID
MRNILRKFKSSKYRCFYKGLTYALLSVMAMFLCIFFIKDKSSTKFDILFSFCLAVICMLQGLASMYKNYETS